MYEPVDSCDGHGGIGEQRIPVFERLIGGDDEAEPFIPVSNEFEQHTGFLFCLFNVTDIVNDKHLVFIQFVQCVLEFKLPFCLLQLLH